MRNASSKVRIGLSFRSHGQSAAIDHDLSELVFEISNYSEGVVKGGTSTFQYHIHGVGCTPDCLRVVYINMSIN